MLPQGPRRSHTPYRELLEKGNKIGDGRTDVRLGFLRETKREFADASLGALATAYLPQAQTYATTRPVSRSDAAGYGLRALGGIRLKTLKRPGTPADADDLKSHNANQS